MNAPTPNASYARVRTAREQGIADGSEGRPTACGDRQYREGYEVGSWQRKVRQARPEQALPACASFH